MLRALLALLLTLTFTTAALAQEAAAPAAPGDPRAATGGATTLEDIMARQRGEKVDMSHRAQGNTGDGAAAIAAQLGTLGGASDSEVFRALRYGTADVTTSSRSPASEVLIQDRGMWWLEFRKGPLATYGAWLLGGTLIALALFYLLRGRIRIDGPKTGRTILRFTSFERFGHWLFAGSFLVLGVTGLIVLFGRMVLIPLLGPQAFSTMAVASKWVHNNVAWAFMVGLVIIIVNWTVHNIPNRHDLKWLAVGGGLFSKNVHPPAKKFNAGQKMIFWGCVVLGLSISASGLSLLFPFELPMFAKTFTLLNDIGAPGWVGLAPLPEQLAPHEEMQFSQLWHTIVAFIFMAMIFAHIYLGSVGMEGAFDAMGSGEVEEQWAREHHGLWVEEIKQKEAARAGTATSPAE
ncbi:formate dehydrogenase subunit gamma [Sedimentitalea arenosa]|jgi:formate dehydrogenase subunit gamma|uniref:Formate dehydrogenase subunit gamma n=1 Tax=Sedimentitalea arenosa TaxID=2798803 RepID=A0A8J7IJB4_9RHOB|nr:formate dehydrogenase subunit gamma [Arenibacterium arenosum]MBJ6370413.1 formate dehydrogenase subunit gamma [Arenibacterium arenosum]